MEKANGVNVIHHVLVRSGLVRERYARKHETVEAEAGEGVRLL